MIPLTVFVAELLKASAKLFVMLPAPMVPPGPIWSVPELIVMPPVNVLLPASVSGCAGLDRGCRRRAHGVVAQGGAGGLLQAQQAIVQEGEPLPSVPMVTPLPTWSDALQRW